ncbi:MAG TPA: hypothetical protein PLG59_06265 [bacterium]|nr:hypothetical protein [bacterium]HQO34246.1 hypothetical protein [bacterium]HQP99099.1 hypothetical protein [bacterium]
MQGIESNKLFQPVPINPLQKNLANFYSNTSKMVKERFDEMMGANDQDKEMGASSSIKESILNRKSLKSGTPWLGQLIDVFA